MKAQHSGPSDHAILRWIFAKTTVQRPAQVIRMEVEHLLNPTTIQQHLEKLILSDQLIHVLAGPTRYDVVSQVSLAIEICGTYAKGKWALWPVPFQSAAWQKNFLRLARYRNYEEIIPGYFPSKVPFEWPLVGQHAGMLWEFSAEGDSQPEFYESLSAAIKYLQGLSSDVLQCVADEYAFQFATTASYDMVFPPKRS